MIIFVYKDFKENKTSCLNLHLKLIYEENSHWKNSKVENNQENITVFISKSTSADTEFFIILPQA